MRLSGGNETALDREGSGDDLGPQPVLNRALSRRATGRRVPADHGVERAKGVCRLTSTGGLESDCHKARGRASICKVSRLEDARRLHTPPRKSPFSPRSDCPPAAAADPHRPPPHPASPPTKKPLVSLMKQARAYGVGVVLATQNPMDLDCRALSNAGTWCLGRLSTHADRKRMLEGLGEHTKKSALAKMLQAPMVRGARRQGLGHVAALPAHAMSYVRGPMTQAEIRRAREATQEILRDGT